MQDFSGKLAVITGGGSGIGQALARLLAAEGCSLALCDINDAGMQETRSLAAPGAPQGVRITTHVVDVADETQVRRFHDEVQAQHQANCVHLLFNNAGVGGGGSLITAPRAQWERTFNICWNGVYLMTRHFLPLLIAAPEAHLTNVSSVNGFWACFGTGVPHTAYSAAKFAVKGFTEALIVDLRVNAPHVGVSVVMPGHIGTPIVLNSMRINDDGTGGAAGTAERAMAEAFGQQFRDSGLPPMEAARIILDGVRANRWRILVGPDAHALDAAVRAAPEDAYGPALEAQLAGLGQAERARREAAGAPEA